MSQYLMPFGIGTRACGGQNLAHMVLRVAIAAMAVNFDITAKLTETNEHTMEIKDAFVSTPSISICTFAKLYRQVLHPITKECKLVFTPRPY